MGKIHNVNQSQCKCIDDYPDKVITVADVLKLIAGKERVCVIDYDSSVTLHDERAEYLTCTRDGCADELCDRVIKFMEIDLNGTLILYVGEKGE